MHIVFICGEYPLPVKGGIGTVVASLAREYVKVGHKVTVIGFYDEAGVRSDGDITILQLAWPRGIPFSMWYRCRRMLLNELRALHAREPITLIEWPDYQGWFWKTIPGVVDVVRLHGTHGVLRHVKAKPPDRVMEIFEGRMLRRVPAWIGCSQWILDTTSEVFSCKPPYGTVIYNPVNVASFAPGTPDTETPFVLYLGGLKRHKGAIHLVEIAREVWKSQPDAKFVFIGPPADLDEAAIRGETGETSERLIFTGGISPAQVAGWMKRARLLAAPSFFEAFSVAWIEAMTSALPVVGTNLISGPEMVRDGVDGLLANPRDHEDFAAKIVRLLQDDDLRRTMGEAGRERAVREFSPDNVAEQSLSFYRECLQRANS